MSADGDEFVCLSGLFDPASAGQTVELVAEINGITMPVKNAGSAKSFTMKGDIKSAAGINPASVSPVLKTRVEITLQADFPFDVTEENAFTVNATSTSDPNYVRYMNVVSANNDDKTLSCMFGGAESGEFQISIRHYSYGLVDTSGMLLDVSASVSNISPKVGSIYGGTLVTITGQNFGDVYTDNPVQISYNGGVGSTDCYVQTTEATQITCRVEPNLEAPRTAGETAELVVFLKTSEEAVCDEVNVCNWAYTDVVPAVTSVTPSYDEALEKHVLTIAGTDLQSPFILDKLTIGGAEQSLISNSATEM
jgi:hypothetical protein